MRKVQTDDMGALLWLASGYLPEHDHVLRVYLHWRTAWNHIWHAQAESRAGSIEDLRLHHRPGDGAEHRQRYRPGGFEARFFSSFHPGLIGTVCRFLNRVTGS